MPNENSGENPKQLDFSNKRTRFINAHLKNVDKGREEGLERLDVEGAGLKNGEGVKGMGGGGHTQYM